MIAKAVMQAVLARLAAGLIILVTLTPLAQAGDRAGIDFIGFSEDGAYFAYEEFGIQDGSGFAYANLHVIELASGVEAKGMPVEIRVEDEGATIAGVRARALEQARPLLDQLAIGHPADILALKGDGALDIDDQTLRFGRPGHGMSAPDQIYEVSLSDVSQGIEPPECAAWGERHAWGFALDLSVDGNAREVYRDTAIAESRGCPQAYRLYAVVMPFDDLAAFAPELTEVMIAIVSVYSMGFEGPDRRFVAVPLGR